MQSYANPWKSIVIHHSVYICMYIYKFVLGGGGGGVAMALGSLVCRVGNPAAESPGLGFFQIVLVSWLMIMIIHHNPRTPS